MTIFVSTDPNPEVGTPFNVQWFDSAFTFSSNPFDILQLFAATQSNFSDEVGLSISGGSNTGVLVFQNVSLNNGFYYFRVKSINGTPYTGTYAFTTEITCYVEGTKILCNVNGVDEYCKIENLCNGIQVKTHSDGYKSITNIGKFKFKNSQSIVNSIYKLEKGKLVATEDLFVSGNHSIVVDNLTEEEKQVDLIARGVSNEFENGFLSLAFMNKNFTRVEDDKYYTLYHLVLENEDATKHYGIYANGILSESMSKQCFEQSNIVDNEMYNTLKIKPNRIFLKGDCLRI